VLSRLWGAWSLAQSHALALGLLASLLTITSLAYRFGRPFFSWLHRSVWIPIREAQTGVPKRTLIVQAGDRRSSYLADAKWGDQPMVQVRIALHLTNVAKQPMKVSKVRLHFRRGHFRNVKEGDINVRHPDQEVFGDYPVLPSRMAIAEAFWMISPPFHKPDRPAAVRVCIIDQFGNLSWSDKIRLFHVKDTRRIF
jgi:hypothetical protein